VEIDAVKGSNSDSEHKLEEAEDESNESAHHASAARVVADNVESAHFAEMVCVVFG